MAGVAADQTLSKNSGGAPRPGRMITLSCASAAFSEAPASVFVQFPRENRTMLESARRARPISRAVTLCLALSGLVALLLAPRPAGADPVPPFVEHWSAPGDHAGWASGSLLSNPGTGGVLGAGDGFLMITTTTPFQLGANSSQPAYTGNWLAAGANKVRFWLKDVGNPNPLEIHFSIGNTANLWQLNTAFIPSTAQWTQFTVDLTDSVDFTHIIAAPPFLPYALALQSVSRVLIRHDLAPYAQMPDTITADFGLDEFEILSSGSTGVPLPGVAIGLPVEMAPPYPNPSRGPVALSLQSHDGSPIRIEVVDVTGRVIRRATLEASSPGPRLWTWDGRTEGGDVAPAGYYRVRAYSAAGGMSQPLVRLGAAR